MQVDDDSTEDEVKLAYRQLAKVCHPDFAGDEGHNICILLNEVRSSQAVKCPTPALVPHVQLSALSS